MQEHLKAIQCALFVCAKRLCSPGELRLLGLARGFGGLMCLLHVDVVKCDLFEVLLIRISLQLWKIISHI